MNRLTRFILKKLYPLEIWEMEHQLKLKKLRTSLEHIALADLGYRVETNFRAKYFVEGQLPDASLNSLYSLVKINNEVNANPKEVLYRRFITGEGYCYEPV